MSNEKLAALRAMGAGNRRGGDKNMNNGWYKMEITPNLTDMILNGMLAAGTRQWAKANIHVLFSPSETHKDGVWKHASVSHHARYPTWDEILDVRYSFFDDGEEVCQILPPKKEYVNLHPNCFHLWSPIGKRLTPLERVYE